MVRAEQVLPLHKLIMKSNASMGARRGRVKVTCGMSEVRGSWTDQGCFPCGAELKRTQKEHLNKLAGRALRWTEMALKELCPGPTAREEREQYLELTEEMREVYDDLEGVCSILEPHLKKDGLLSVK